MEFVVALCSMGLGIGCAEARIWVTILARKVKFVPARIPPVFHDRYERNPHISKVTMRRMTTPD